MTSTMRSHGSDTSATESPNGDQSSSANTHQGKNQVAERGRTMIADSVVEKIAGIAARDVVGVHAMGSGLARTFGAMRERVPGGSSSPTRGVKAEVGEVQTALDMEIVVDYGVSIPRVTGAVRENVVAGVERMTGLEVIEVNVTVGDVKLPDDEEDDESNSESARPQ